MKKQVHNPYLPSYEYVPDGEPHLFEGRLYIYGSHDRFGGKSFCMNDYVCYSAPEDDLSDWRYEGVIYRRSQDPIKEGLFQHHMWAPDVARGNDGRYYLYYGMEWTNRIAVAVSSSPDGPFEFLGEVRYPDGTRYGGKKGEGLRFDPAVINDDGRIYLYAGFSSNSFPFTWIKLLKKGSNIDGKGNAVVELEDDMLTIKRGPIPLIPGVSSSEGTSFKGHEFYEASSIRKFDGKYYFIYSSSASHELCYAASEYPDQGFVYQGVIHSNGYIIEKREAVNDWGNNHGSIEKVGDAYYVFGHRPTNLCETNRQGIAERIEFKDGHFLFAPMTSQGLNGKPLKTEGSYEAGICFCLFPRGGGKKVTRAKGHPFLTQDGGDREDDPGQYIANFRPGCVAGYRYFEIKDDEISMSLRVRPHRGGKVNGVLLLSDSIEMDDPFKVAFSLEGERDIAFKWMIGKGKRSIYLSCQGSKAIDVISLSFLGEAD